MDITELNKLKIENEEQALKIKKLEDKLITIEKDFQQLFSEFKNHSHSGTDGSSKYFQNGLDVKPGSSFKTGNCGLEEVTLFDNTVVGGLTVGLNARASGVVDSVRDGSQFTIQHQAPTNKSTNQTFIEGKRSPIFTTNNIRGNFVSGTSLFRQSGFNWDTNELAGAYLNVFNQEQTTFSNYKILSNTSNEITIDGTFSFSASDAVFDIYVPIYLGSANTPWRRLYTINGVDGGLRFGGGATGNGQNSLLYTDGTNLFFRRANNTVGTVTLT